MEGLSVPKMHSDCREAEGDGGSGGGGGDENINDKVDDGTQYNGSKPKSVDDDNDDDDDDDHNDEDWQRHLEHWLAPPGQSQRQLIVESASGNL